jgi:hypothetical protein
MKTIANFFGIALLFAVLSTFGQTNEAPRPQSPKQADLYGGQSILTERQLTEGIYFQTSTISRILGVRMTVDGAVPRAVRLSQPWQLINPFAPAQFGDGWDNVSVDPHTGRAVGFLLLNFKF